MSDSAHMQNRENLDTLFESVQHITRKLASRPVTGPGLEPLTRLELLVLQTVQRAPGTTAKNVAQTLNLLPSNTSTALKRLTSLGLIARTRDPADARRVTLRLTPTALRNIQRVHDAWAQRLAGIDIPGDQLAVTASVLGRIDTWLTEGATAPVRVTPPDHM